MMKDIWSSAFFLGRALQGSLEIFVQYEKANRQKAGTLHYWVIAVGIGVLVYSAYTGSSWALYVGGIIAGVGMLVMLKRWRSWLLYFADLLFMWGAYELLCIGLLLKLDRLLKHGQTQRHEAIPPGPAGAPDSPAGPANGAGRSLVHVELVVYGVVIVALGVVDLSMRWGTVNSSTVVTLAVGAIVLLTRRRIMFFLMGLWLVLCAESLFLEGQNILGVGLLIFGAYVASRFWRAK